MSDFSWVRRATATTPGWVEDIGFNWEAVVRECKDEIVGACNKHTIEKTPLNPDMDPRDAFVILAEEVGEVARAMTYDGEKGAGHLRGELVQVATMALAMAAALDYRIDNGPV